MELIYVSKKITVHNSENNPIYDILLEQDFDKLAKSVEALGYKNRSNNKVYVRNSRIYRK